MNGFYLLAARFFLNMATGNHLEMVFFIMGKSCFFIFHGGGQSIAMFDWRVAPSDWEKLPVISPWKMGFFLANFLGCLCWFRVESEWMKNWDIIGNTMKIHGYTEKTGFWYRWPSYSWFTYWNCVSIAMLLCQRILCVEVGWEWFSKLQTHTKKRYPLVI